MSQGVADVEARAKAAKRGAMEAAQGLMAELEESAVLAGWVVNRSESDEQAAQYVVDLARGLKASLVVHSAHPVIERLRIEGALVESGIKLQLMGIGRDADETERDAERVSLREAAIKADIGVTGVDYAIAETGTCVLLARRGVSRLVSLLPPVHVAVVEEGQVLPSLDELFTLQRLDYLQGKGGGYMNLISGPSRSADIEQTIVTGVHGPREAHMVLLG